MKASRICPECENINVRDASVAIDECLYCGYKFIDLYKRRRKLLCEIVKETQCWKNADVQPSLEKSICILVEKVGEFSKAVNDCDYEHTRRELIQVAAYALKMLEHYDGNIRISEVNDEYKNNT